MNKKISLFNLPLLSSPFVGISSKPPVTRKGRKGNKELQNGAGDTFTVPRTIELTLSPSPLQTIDVLPLRYYSEFIWLIDFTLCTAIGERGS